MIYAIWCVVMAMFDAALTALEVRWHNALYAVVAGVLAVAMAFECLRHAYNAGRQRRRRG